MAIFSESSIETQLHLQSHSLGLQKAMVRFQSLVKSVRSY